ncbi:MAG: DedA family protein [Flavobacteriales bacterium]|nr:DedA family protein [Flavobacteriales bacterium]MCB9193375.1 DedA family protein [Flavobacteriales bacterium]
MELGPAWQDLGLPGLFLASFLAATILPFSSEALLAAMELGPWSPWSLWACASLGNTLGGLSSYGLGRLGNGRRIGGWLGASPEQADRVAGRVQRWGSWSALLCWLPVVGDPIAIALGLFRSPLLPVSLMMFIGKAARYALVLGAMQAIL